MERLINNRRGDFLTSHIVFIILVIIFISSMAFFIAKKGDGDFMIEDLYSKKIAILLDRLKPGMQVELDISDLKDVVEENEFKQDFLKIDNFNREVFVKVSDRTTSGVSYEYFSDFDFLEYNINGNKLFLRVS